MQEPRTVEDALRLLEPMFISMLTPSEMLSAEYELVSADAAFTGPALEPDVLLSSRVTLVRWRVLGEQGWSGGLRDEESPETMVRFVQSDLQDWISQSGFGWGQLRGPVDLP